MAKPTVSVIIPTYNRLEGLRACLEALCRSEKSDFEVVVVDDGSEESARPIVNDFIHRLDIRCIYQSNSGPARARNTGAESARSDILAFTDDDCQPDPGWLGALFDELEKTPGALVGGHTVNLFQDNIFSEASQDLVTFLYEFATFKKKGFDFFTSNNIACLKKQFLAMGGFDETFPLAAAEDRDFGLRWKAAGQPLIFAARAIVLHAHRLDLMRFWRQHANYGRGARHLRWRTITRDGRAVPFEGLRFYAMMISYPFREKRPRAMLRMTLIGLSQVAMTAGFIRELRHPAGGAPA